MFNSEMVNSKIGKINSTGITDDLANLSSIVNNEVILKPLYKINYNGVIIDFKRILYDEGPGCRNFSHIKKNKKFYSPHLMVRCSPDDYFKNSILKKTIIIDKLAFTKAMLFCIMGDKIYRLQDRNGIIQIPLTYFEYRRINVFRENMKNINRLF